MTAPLFASEVVDIPSKNGAATRTLLLQAENPKATVLLFIGGDGQLQLSDDGQTKHGHTFVRSIKRWSGHQISAVLVDTPFDLGNAMRGHQRGSDDHLNRVSEVISFYSKVSNKPLWIFGHSMGTSTVSAFLNSERSEISLLSGFIVAGTHKGETVPTSIRLPALGIHHAKDACEATPVEATEAIIRSRSPDTRKAVILLSGGDDKGHRCQSRGYHGFNGIEHEFIDTAAAFVLQN